MGAEAEPGWYVYGIVPEDVELAADAGGVGDPPGRIRIVRQGEIAALVSQIDPARPLQVGDLRAHRDLLDDTAAEVPVLPLPFGSVVADRAAVAKLLESDHDVFAAALRELDGHAQYVIEARPVGPPEAEAASGDAVTGDAIASQIADEVEGCCAATRIRDPPDDAPDGGSGSDGVEVAILVATAREADLEDAMSGLADDWNGSVRVLLRGPMAPYDFVTPLTPQEEPAPQ